MQWLIDSFNIADKKSITIDWDYEIDYSDRRIMQLSIGDKEDKDRICVCYADPSNRKQDFIGYLGLQTVQKMAFISNDLILTKLLYINTNRFGIEVSTSNAEKKYSAILDLNGYLRPVPPELSQVGKVFACPQENGKQILFTT